MVHKRSDKKYSEKYLKYLIKKEMINIVLDYAIYDHNKGEVISTLNTKEALDKLRERLNMQTDS